ncbi:MAG: hypothetical protein H9855_02015, partial [Candidatus Acinetobacter avistercoris]|uniref:hypothetical protein n=1 Tax=Acinetobacter sp. KS-LM10 TaxID=3120518 RepID=UPI001FA68B46|nr:hypothetical protein [Candidatus Acinetobacter avistercoris]
MNLKEILTICTISTILFGCGGGNSTETINIINPPSPPQTPSVPIIPSTPNSYSTHVYFLGSSTVAGMQESISKWENNYNLHTENYAKGGELIDSMCIRIGALPALVKFNQKNISTGIKNYFKQDWVKDTSMKTFTVKISDVEGSIGVDTSGYFFIPNESFSVNEQTYYPIQVQNNFEKNSIFIVNLGKNNLLGGTNDYNEATYVLSKSRQCIDWINENITDRIIVMGHFTTVSPTNSIIERVDFINNSLKNNYLYNFFDFKAYIDSNDIWQDTGIRATALDIEAKKINAIPPSLSADSLHLNSKASSASVNKIYELIKSKQWVH